MLKHGLIALALTLVPAAAVAQPADVAAALSAPGRPATAVELDALRRPAEVLAWAGLKRGDRVLDYFTGSGYYAEIMARAVGAQGAVLGWNPESFGNNPQTRAAVDAVHGRSPNATFTSSPVTALSLPANSFDFVLLHMVYHDAYFESAEFGLPRIDPNSVTRALFAATKPGGTVAVIDHVANAGGDTRQVVDALHRIDPAVIRADFERAGFVFDGESPLLRNAADNHTQNVFDPAIRGRTDRVLYRFRKPA